MMSQSWTCKQGQCLLIPSGPGEYKHLFTILVNPQIMPSRGNRPHVLSVGISSIRDGIPYDDACIIRPGEHPFISHDSYVRYRNARIDPADDIERHVKNGLFSIKDPCSQHLLQRILDGALRSRHASREIKQLIDQFR